MSDTEPTNGFAKAAQSIEAERRVSGGVHPSPGQSWKPPEPDSEPPEPGDNTRQLRSLVDRVVRLEEEKQALSEDVKVIYGEAKSAGYNPKSLRILVKEEMEDDKKRGARLAVEEDAEIMRHALGAFASTGLGEAAMKRVRR